MAFRLSKKCRYGVPAQFKHWLVANEHLNLAETSSIIPKYLAEVAHVIADPETVTYAQSFLYREP